MAPRMVVDSVISYLRLVREAVAAYGRRAGWGLYHALYRVLTSAAYLDVYVDALKVYAMS